jgi:hypothetical protein
MVHTALPACLVGVITALILSQPVVEISKLKYYSGDPSSFTTMAGKMGTPWVVAAFVVGAVVGRATRSIPISVSVGIAATCGALCLVVANARYYAVYDIELVEPGRPGFWTLASIIVGVGFGGLGATWMYNRSTAAARLSIVALAFVVSVEPVVWWVIRPRKGLHVEFIALMVVIGMTLPLLSLPLKTHPLAAKPFRRAVRRIWRTSSGRHSPACEPARHS